VFTELAFGASITDYPKVILSKMDVDRWMIAIRPFLFLTFWGATFSMAVVGGTKLRIVSGISCVVGIGILLL
jgi:hypothetical protein